MYKFYFPKQYAQHIRMSSCLIVVKIEVMKRRRENRIMYWIFMWPSCLCYFRIDHCASFKLSVFLPYLWNSMFNALNLVMPLTELYMGRPLLVLYLVVNLDRTKLNELHTCFHSSHHQCDLFAFQLVVGKWAELASLEYGELVQ